MKKRHLVMVEWIDTAGGSSWRAEDEDFGTGCLTHTVGWQLKSSRKAITITSTRNEWGDCLDRETIPRGAIKSIRRLE